MKRLRPLDYFNINVYWFALSYLWNSLGPIILPALVPPLVPAALKGSALGLLTSVGLVVAIVVQPVAGAISDRSTFRWGRRRPYILVGTLFDLLFLLGIGLSGRYWFLFASYFLLQFSSNVAHGPYQGIIPDLVPEDKRGAASGAKQLLEILGVITTSLITGRLMGQGRVGLALGSIMGLLMLFMLITVLGVREEPVARAVEAPQRQVGRWPGFEDWVLRVLRLLFHSPDFFWWLVSRLFILLGINLVRNFALYFVSDVLKLPNPLAAVGDLLAVLAVVILFVVYPSGHLSDRLGRKPLILFSGLVGAVGALLLLFARSYNDLLIYGGVLGLSIGVFLAVNWAWGTDLIPREEAGRYLGISNIATAGAGVVAGLGGPLLDFFNLRRPGLGYTALFITAALCYLLGTAFAGVVRETRKRG
ncbi:MAG: MFS transporter [Anaerolineae bacterium]